MLALLRTLTPPLLSLVFMMMASGLFNTFVSIRLEMEGYVPEDIGIVTSALYLGILVGSLRIDRWIAHVGHIRSFVAFAVILAILVLSQSFWINPWYWSVLRFIGGICMAGIFIVIESWILMESGPKMRGAALSLYLAVLYAALSLGQFLIDASDPSGFFPFCITAILLIVSVLPVSMHKVAEPTITHTTRLSVTQLFRISPLGFIGGIVSGMLLAVVYGLVPVYAGEVGMSVSEIGTFMAILIFGGFSLQWPLGRWADRGDRRRVLNIASFITATLGLSIALLDHTSPILLFILAWLFGGFSFTLYPLSMAYACERVKEEQIVAATGGFVLSYGIGAIAGPLLAPLAMTLLGSSGLFYFLALISLLLGLIGLKRPATAIVD
ncbi:MAG TPA: MFS transporter [Chlamydiales bacterium]|nr:MFS transporter [Chlamydiales bacterium]